jgi:methylamine dehydrogenase accessory protein MauD
MASVLLIVRVVLAAIFGVAGLAKMADRSSARQALAGFGVPARMAAPLGRLLPLVELAVAAALIPLASAWFGAVAALGLLLVFTAAIGINLALGRTPACRCFGQLHPTPVGWGTLGRNGLLAASAGLVVWGGRETAGLSGPSWSVGLEQVQLAWLAVALIGAAALAAESWFLLQLFRQQGRLLVRIDSLEKQLAGRRTGKPLDAPPAAPGLPNGSVAPLFQLPSLKSEPLHLDRLRAAGRPVLLVFTDPGCGACAELWPDIARWQREPDFPLEIALLSRGNRQANRKMAAENGLKNILLQKEDEVARAYQVIGTPTGVLVGPDGLIASPLAEGADAIRALAARAAGHPDSLPPPAAAPCNCGNGNGHVAARLPRREKGLKIGEPAPTLRLPGLDGEEIGLASLRGQPVLVLFWNPNCGFCKKMLPALKDWEANPPAGSPQLLVVSTGSVESNRALNLRSPVALDHGFEIGRAFGASGTPSAILVDADGRIASGVAVGAEDIFALAGNRRTAPVNG